MTTTPVPCPGPCNAAWRKAEEADTPHDLEPRWGDPVHCPACARRTRAQLGELPELIVAIWIEATHGTRGGPKTGTIGRIGGGMPAWPGQASRLLTDHIVGGLTELEDDWRNLRGLNPRQAHGSEGTTVTATVRFLDVHLDWALTHHPCASDPHERDSPNPASQINTWHRTATRFTRRDKRADHYPMPCPRCDLLTLFRGEGDDYIECRNPACGTLLTVGEYHDRTREVAADIRHEESGLAKIQDAA